MSIISSHLEKDLGETILTLSTFWQLKLKDGTVLGFTDGDSNVSINGTLYIADSGFTPSAIVSSGSLTVDNTEVEGILSADVINSDDIIAGRYDYAEISVFLGDYINLDKGLFHLSTGRLGEVNFSEQRFIAEIRGFAQSFCKKAGDLYSPVCRATFCDNMCKADISKYKRLTTVLSVISSGKIVCFPLEKPSGYFNFGKLKFLTGHNSGFVIEIKNHTNDDIEFVLPLHKAISAGDELEIIAGCDKSFSNCINKFNNAINFRGEPNVPQIRKLL
jgi:uncharacterized phage protein (TIGR02218 family)